MRNHGVAVVGATVEEATILAIMLENACQIQLLRAGRRRHRRRIRRRTIQRLHHNITRAEQYSDQFRLPARGAHAARPGLIRGFQRRGSQLVPLAIPDSRT